MINSATEKPEPDYLRNWYKTQSTQWLLDKLHIQYQEDLEEMHDVMESGLTGADEIRAIHFLQSRCHIVESIIDTITDAGGDDV